MSEAISAESLEVAKDGGVPSIREFAQELKRQADVIKQQAETIRQQDATLARVIDDFNNSLIRVAEFDEVYGTNQESHGHHVSTDLESYPRNEKWGRQVLAVIPFPVDATDRITALTHLSAEPINGNQVQITVGAVKDPPLVVYFDGADHWLADGFHRLAAARLAGRVEIECDVRQGSRREALLFAVGANSAHGLRRSNADKQRAVRLLLEDAEWSQSSDRWIAERCGVSNTMVSSMRDQLSKFDSCGNGQAAAGGEVRLGRDGKLRRAPEKPAEPPTPEPLIDRSGRTIFPYGCGTEIEDFEHELRELWRARGASARLAAGACAELIDAEDTEYYEECIDRAAEVLETSVTMNLEERAKRA